MSPKPPARRALVLIAKLLQNAASGVVFKKEVYMLPLNAYVATAAAQCERFYANVCADVPTPTDAETGLVSAADVVDDLRALHRYACVLLLLLLLLLLFCVCACVVFVCCVVVVLVLCTVLIFVG